MLLMILKGIIFKIRRKIVLFAWMHVKSEKSFCLKYFSTSIRNIISSYIIRKCIFMLLEIIYYSLCYSSVVYGGGILSGLGVKHTELWSMCESSHFIRIFFYSFSILSPFIWCNLSHPQFNITNILLALRCLHS